MRAIWPSSVLLILLSACDGGETPDVDGGSSPMIDGGSESMIDSGTSDEDGGAEPADGGTALDASALDSAVSDSAVSDSAVSDSAVADAGPEVSAACLGVLEELGAGVVDDAGLTADYVARASSCGFRLAAFGDIVTTARWQGSWRFEDGGSGRYLLDASRVVSTGDRLLVAVYDTMPIAPTASISLVADDQVFCEVVTYLLTWPELGGGEITALSTLDATRAPVADADVATVCRHGRVHRIDVAPFPELASNLTPFVELTTSAGGGRLWGESTLVPRSEGQSGFAIAISTARLTSGTTPRLSMGGARATIAGECRSVAVILDFPYETGAPPSAASWTIAGALDPLLCRGRSTTRAVSDGYLLID